MRLSQKDFDKMMAKSHCKINPQSQQVKKPPKEAKMSKIEELVYWELWEDPDVEILKTQPVFPLISEFTRGGKKYQGIKYTADFRINENGKEVVIEVKSTGVLKARRVDYPMRRKLFLRAFPELLFREIIFDDDGNREIREY
jgi:hypothetical protein